MIKFKPNPYIGSYRIYSDTISAIDKG